MNDGHHGLRNRGSSQIFVQGPVAYLISSLEFKFVEDTAEFFGTAFF